MVSRTLRAEIRQKLAEAKSKETWQRERLGFRFGRTPYATVALRKSHGGSRTKKQRAGQVDEACPSEEDRETKPAVRGSTSIAVEL